MRKVREGHNNIRSTNNPNLKFDLNVMTPNGATSSKLFVISSVKISTFLSRSVSLFILDQSCLVKDWFHFSFVKFFIFCFTIFFLWIFLLTGKNEITTKKWGWNMFSPTGIRTMVPCNQKPVHTFFCEMILSFFKHG